MVNSKAMSCFSYIPTMLTNALPGCTVDKRYGNLATSIGPIMKSYTTTILITFNYLKGSMLGEISITSNMQMIPIPPLWQKVKRS